MRIIYIYIYIQVCEVLLEEFDVSVDELDRGGATALHQAVVLLSLHIYIHFPPTPPSLPFSPPPSLPFSRFARACIYIDIHMQ